MNRWTRQLKIAEFEILPIDGDGTEWLVMYLCDGRVSFAKEYLSNALGGERTSWHDQGISVGFEHLDSVIEALQRVRAGLLEGASRDAGVG